MGNSTGQVILDDLEYNTINKYDVMFKRAQGRRSTKHKNFRERLFILTPKAIIYFDGKTPENHGEFKGVVLLRNITKVEAVNESVLNKSYCLLVEHVELSLFIIADNEEKRMGWIHAIREACFKINGPPKDRSASEPDLMLSTGSLDTAQKRETRIWAKAYDSFQSTHPRGMMTNLFQRFDLITTLVPEIQFGSNVKHLPLDIIVRIFSYLSVKELFKLRLVCKEWNKVIDKSSIWKSSIISNVMSSVVISLCTKYGRYIENLTIRTVSGKVTDAFNYLANVSYMTLDHAELDFNAIPSLCPNLVSLCINNCKLLASINKPNSDQKLISLNKLEFKFMESFKQEAIQNLLETCPNITSLLLSGSVKIRCTVFELVPSLTQLKLENVNLDATQIAIYCPKLINLSFMWLKFIGPTSGSLSKLKTLTISYQETCVLETMLKIFQCAPSLTTLILNGLLDMSPDVFMQLVPYFQQVRTLVIKRCTMLTNDCLLHISNYCHKLEYLDISDLGHISTDGVLAILYNEPQLLKYLDISCTKIEEEVFRILKEKCIRLEKLGMSACPNVDDKCLQLLSSHPSLKYLDISESKLITHKGLNTLVSKNKVLMYVNVSNCRQIEMTKLNVREIGVQCTIVNN